MFSILAFMDNTMIGMSEIDGIIPKELLCNKQYNECVINICGFGTVKDEKLK